MNVYIEQVESNMEQVNKTIADLSWKNKMISIVIIMLPILASYGLFGIDFATIALIFVSVIIIIKDDMISFYKSPLQPLLIYIILLTPILLLLSHICELEKLPFISTVFLRYGKLIVLLFLTFNLGIGKYFDLNYSFKVMKVMVCINVMFISIQFISNNFFNAPLLNPLMKFGINALKDEEAIISNGLYRPSAFFEEPAHLAQYFFIFLCYALFYPNLLMKKRLIDTTVASIGIILSTSGMGIVGLLLLLIIFIFHNLRKKIVMQIIFIVVLIAISLLLYNTNYMQMILERITSGDAIKGRVGTGYKIFLKLPLLFQIFGCGFGNITTNVYLNGMEYSLISIGLIGTVILLYISFKTFKKNLIFGKMLLLTFLGLLFISQNFTTITLVMNYTIFSYIMSNTKKVDK